MPNEKPSGDAGMFSEQDPATAGQASVEGQSITAEAGDGGAAAAQVTDPQIPDNLDEVLNKMWERNGEEGLGEPPAAKDDPKRHEYWQSKHDKTAKENKELKDLLAEYQNYDPLIQRVRSKPELLDRLKDDAPVAQGLKQESVEVPEPPKRPGSFNAAEALADPNSESAKYLVAQQDWQARWAEFQFQKERARSEKEAVAEKQQMQLEARRSKLRQVHSELQTNYGFAPDDATKFLGFFADPKSLELPSMVKIWKAMNPSPAAQKAAEMKARQAHSKVPPPLSAIGGQTEQQLSEQDSFNLGLLRNRRTTQK